MLDELGIQHKLIKVFTPRHNGKVERSYRKDNQYKTRKALNIKLPHSDITTANTEPTAYQSFLLRSK